MRAKFSNLLIRIFGVFVSIFIGLWVAAERGPRDGIRHFEIAALVSLVVWAIYCALVYSLAFAWSRWRRSAN